MPRGCEMKFRFEKNMRILVDLATYCHKHGATSFNMNLNTTDQAAEFTVSATVRDVSREELQDLVEILNSPRHQEVEQNYWGLTGEVETDCELTLVGMMVDEAEIQYKNGTLTIHAKRYD